MLKMFVSKAVKAAWENAGTAAPTDQAAEDAHYDHPTNFETEATEEVAISPSDLGIDLPYYPGQGTSCGSSCRCSWEIDIRYSVEHGGNAIFATWRTKGDDACPDCQERAAIWNDEFICLQQS